MSNGSQALSRPVMAWLDIGEGQRWETLLPVSQEDEESASNWHHVFHKPVRFQFVSNFEPMQLVHSTCN